MEKKRVRLFAFRPGFLAAFFLILFLEACIAELMGDQMLRSTVEAVTAIPLAYCLLAAFLHCPRFVPFLLLLLAFAVEAGQLFQVFGSPGDGTMLQLVFGGTFDPVDLLCYIIGALFVDIARSVSAKRRVQARRQAQRRRTSVERRLQSSQPGAAVQRKRSPDAR